LINLPRTIALSRKISGVRGFALTIIASSAEFVGDFPPAAAAREVFRRRKYAQFDLRRVRGSRLHSERSFGAGVLPQPREGKAAPGWGLGKPAEPVSPESTHKFCRRAPKSECGARLRSHAAQDQYSTSLAVDGVRIRTTSASGPEPPYASSANSAVNFAKSRAIPPNLRSRGSLRPRPLPPRADVVYFLVWLCALSVPKLARRGRCLCAQPL